MKSEKSKKSKRRWLFAALRIGLAIGLAVLIFQFRLSYFEGFFYDMRVRTRPAPATSGNIVLVTVDQKTQEDLQRLPDANDFVKLFNRLARAKPRRVVYTNNFNNIMGSYGQLQTLAEAAKRTNLLILKTNALPDKGVEDEFRLLPPLQDLDVESGPVTVDDFNFARDGVSRRVILTFEGKPLAQMQLADQINGKKSVKDYRGVFTFKRTQQAYINFRPTGTYPNYSFVDVEQGYISPKKFRGKIVIVGIDNKANENDYAMTPYSRDQLAMSTAELQANMIDTLILNNAPVQVPNWLNLMITCLIAIITVFIVLALRPVRGLYILVLTLAGYLFIAWLLFATAGIWIDVSHPLLTVFICYYFFIPYRLIIENRRSWEYFQRNNLLVQVEELKSNFLRLMSHDLKTPLARIQGMTEIALRDSSHLTSQQQDAIKTISDSSQELTQFVGSILNLGRIESKDIKLQLKSRDINALLTETIQKLDYYAKQKSIRIVTEFEPLFSVKIDEDLIRQVFSNLIENAVKYSPDGSSVLVTTEEQNGRLMVQVADQGMGIPGDEIENLFAKFYRSRTVRDGAIKGSGLGLYLARYFVHLHNGQISVESELTKGSTFTVELPMDL